MPTKKVTARKRTTTGFKVPKKPFWARIGGVDVLIRPPKVKGKIPDRVIEHAFNTVFGPASSKK